MRQVTAAQKLPAEDQDGKDDELQKMLDRIWKRYDADRSKALDKAEMFLFIREVFGSRVSEEEAGSIFAEVDLDNNGVIDRREMLKFIKKLQ